MEKESIRFLSHCEDEPGAWPLPMLSGCPQASIRKGGKGMGDGGPSSEHSRSRGLALSLEARPAGGADAGPPPHRPENHNQSLNFGGGHRDISKNEPHLAHKQLK